MSAKLDGNDVAAYCPICERTATFSSRYKGNELGSFKKEFTVRPSYGSFLTTKGVYTFQLLRCAGCGYGGYAIIRYKEGEGYSIALFYPDEIYHAELPLAVPDDIKKEYREAERCMGFKAFRAASVLFRSALEKTLKVNGYVASGIIDKMKLYKKIEEAAADGVITRSRQRRAHDDVRTLGNDVLHEEYCEIKEEAAATAGHYVQRIFEDFYDHRAETEAVLIEKGRLAAKEPDTPGQ